MPVFESINIINWTKNKKKCQQQNSRVQSKILSATHTLVPSCGTPWLPCALVQDILSWATCGVPGPGPQGMCVCVPSGTAPTTMLRHEFGQGTWRSRAWRRWDCLSARRLLNYVQLPDFHRLPRIANNPRFNKFFWFSSSGAASVEMLIYLAHRGQPVFHGPWQRWAWAITGSGDLNCHDPTCATE